MKHGPTLADTLYRISFQNQPVHGWGSNAMWRDALRRAKKFVLDEPMSTFLGELGTRTFVGAEKRTQAVRDRMCENIRMSARLPGEITWVEYDLRACQVRSHELLERPVDPLQMPRREGWLLVRHPQIETAFMAMIVSHDPDHDHGDGFDTWTFPVALAWTADMGSVIPWKLLPWTAPEKRADGWRGAHMSEVSTGITGYKTERCGFVFSPYLDTPNKPKAITELLEQWAGVQRRMWAFLATINDLPVITTEVRASKGFIGKGSYRKFLDHRTITLTVPVKHYTKIIRGALAAVHRRGGPVREHWRKDWRKPLSILCEHEWGADEKHMFCTLCKGRKIWVIEHVRGDTSVGFVTHDFKVTHEKDSPSGT